MECKQRGGIGICLVGAFCLSWVVGCGQNSPSDAPKANPGANLGHTTESPIASTNPAALAASAFLEAVIQGDTERASASLTPLAVQKIAQSGKQFAPPGLETAKFRIGQIRNPSPTQALVQCLLTDMTQGGQQRSEEMCCLLRLVENEWRVSGIAFSTGPNRPPTILDFENPERGPRVAQPMAGGASPRANPGTTSRPSPPRTAQEAPLQSLR